MVEVNQRFAVLETPEFINEIGRNRTAAIHLRASVH
jgi:hypothetical protein